MLLARSIRVYLHSLRSLEGAISALLYKSSFLVYLTLAVSS